ncbi:MAG: flavodoxin domain-containing protein [candidate division Zixibacteria bacterium]|nr:flavodoxin domain-containing protein [candidate division Zixibacteria bacterium]
MRPIEIAKNVYWVGAVDWNLRDFHGYQTEKGSTYNAYLIKGEKAVLFDTVKADLADQFLNSLSMIIDPSQIDYIVANHAEMDHTGALPKVMEAVKPEKLFCTAKGQQTIEAHLPCDGWPFAPVKEGDLLELGDKTIEFIGSPMLHWPESMVSHVREDNILISNDIFGQHWATSERFDDEVDPGELHFQAAKYYANIFLPMSAGMRKFLAKLETKGIAPAVLATDHGLIWRRDIAGIMRKYIDWSEQKAGPKAVVVYDTMWGSTMKMANAIAEGIRGAGEISVGVYDLRYNHRSDVITEILDAKAVVVGSPVLNKNILPKMADMLTYMKGLAPVGKIGAAFGSYGWQDTIVKRLNEMLTEMKVEVIDDGVSVNYVPKPDDIKRCVALGEKIREAIKRG